MHQLSVTWQHMRRSPYQAVAAILVMTITIYTALFFGLLSLAGYKVLSAIESRPSVIAFFNDTITEKAQVTDTIDKLENTGLDPAIKFVSKDEALKLYQERNKDDPLLLELVTANTLPSSLEVSGQDLDDLPSFYEILKTEPNIEEISYQQDIVKPLTTITDRVRQEGLLLVGFLILTSQFTLLTIIGMKIALRRKEIEVERLVGATNFYISMPFLLEGFFYGVIGGLIAWGVIYARIYMETPALSQFLSGTSLLPVSPVLMLELLAVTILVGGAIGVLGSFFAVWRYLRARS